MKKINEKTLKKVRKIMMITSILSFAINMVPTVYAADDPIGVINNLSNFIFTLTRAVGTIILTFGAIQIGMSYQSHDPSQRTNGVFTLVGGVIITFAKEIIGYITG